jgi:tRNA dimethylallyltransferase
MTYSDHTLSHFSFFVYTSDMIASKPTTTAPDRTKPKILVILGPTAVGKSDLAVDIARWIAQQAHNGEPIGGYIGAEIVSADSRQVYRHLDIGTGKVTEREMKGIPHHLIDIAEPSERLTALDWKRRATRTISEIIARGNLPIVCGGTGFYITTLIDDLGFPEVPANTAEQQLLEAQSVEALFDELQRIDPERAKTIDMRNKRRLSRAIIIARALGTVPKLSSTKNTDSAGGAAPYDALQIGIDLPDADLRARIKARLIRRIEAPNKDGMNMIQETERLHAPRPDGLGLSYERMDELGLEYRYLSLFLQMKIDKMELIETLRTKIWQYAKRQRTWWKKDARISWFSPTDIDGIKSRVNGFLTNH